MPDKLSVVIPAYNEEGAIASVVENVRGARGILVGDCDLSDVEIIVVNDGSRDRTAEIVRGFPDVVLVEHPVNRGYGAALKTGFARATGNLLAFLDGDGTCDAKDFGPMVRRMSEADLILGTRLHAKSEMPKVRRLGNRIFALLTTVLSGRGVSDIATGMRVFRKDVLDRLPPLPDGLHFTPAMTCHALCLSDVRVAEQEIAYAERIGHSKLSVVKDGFRFLKIILDSALVYFPLKFLGSFGALILVGAIAYGIQPVMYYARHRALEEGMLYRLLSIVVFATTGLTFAIVGIAAQNIAYQFTRHQHPSSGVLSWFASLRVQYMLLAGGLLSALAGVGLNGGNLVEYLRFGRISAHWSYILTGGLLVLLGALLFALGVLLRMTGLLAARRR